MTPPGRPAVLALAGALVLTGALVGVGTALAGGETHPAEPFRTTALEDYDTSAVEIGRAAFCEDIDPRQVEAALGAEPSSETEWENGDRVALPSGGRDVLHEYGCEYVAADGTTARAWVFAPPVDEQRAKRLVKAARTEACDLVDAPAYGDPSVALSCALDGSRSASYRGLFGDAWLTCELSVTDTTADPIELSDRAGRWCVGVAEAAS